MWVAHRQGWGAEHLMPLVGAIPRPSENWSPPVPGPSPSLLLSVQGVLTSARAVTAPAGGAVAVPHGTLLG